MHIDIQTRGFPLSNALATYVKRRFSQILTSDNRHILRTQVRLADINGPRGGVDKRCQFNVTLAGTSNVVIQETSEDMYSAIDKAAQRARRTIARRLGRMGTHRLPGKMRRSLSLNKHSIAE